MMPDANGQMTADEIAASQVPPQALGGGMSGAQPSFFRSLVGTLLAGVSSGLQAPVQRGVGPAIAAQRAAQSPLVNPQVRQQQFTQDQMDKLKLATAQINLQQSYHMLLNTDKTIQDQAYLHGRDFAEKMIESDKMENMFTGTREAATKKLNELQQKDIENAGEYTTLPAPGFDPSSGQFAVVHFGKNDRLTEDMKFHDEGDPENGISAFDWTAPRHMMMKDAYSNSKCTTRAKWLLTTSTKDWPNLKN
jgi:hypothetical protein